MTVRLTVIRGPRAGEVFESDADEITIGSGNRSDLIVRDNDVSAAHCRLMRIQQDYDIEDLNSNYGTFVNGQPIHEKQVLKSGSIIELGSQVAVEYVRIGVTDTLMETGTFRAVEPDKQPCLVLVEEGNIRAAYLLQSIEIRVGRSVSNDIVIQKTDISRNHMMLMWQDGKHYLKDLNSRNGTFVNGMAVTNPVPLKHSDVVRMATSTQLHYVYRADLPSEWDPSHNEVEDDKRDTGNASTFIPFKAPRREGTRDLTQQLKEGELEDHIFIVYAREDWEDIVAPIVLNLNDSKQQVWVDQHLRPGSEGWRQAVAHAQLECWLLVVVVSPSAMNDENVKEQYRYFYNREKPIILVNYRPVKRLPIQLSNQPLIDYDRENPGKMFRRLQYEILHLKPSHLRKDGEEIDKTGFLNLPDNSNPKG